MAYIWVSLILVCLVPTISGDPEPLQDFCVADTFSSTVFMNGLPCIDPTKATAKDFTTSVLSSHGNTSGSPFGMSVIVATADVLPGINTLGLIMGRVDIAVGGVLPPHTHPRATEMIYLLEGKLKVGFVDTTNKLFSVDIKEGDVFVYPKGLVHFAQNIGNCHVSLIAVLNTQTLGTSILPLVTFASQPAIPSSVLAKSFQINVAEVENIRKSLGGS